MMMMMMMMLVCQFVPSLIRFLFIGRAPRDVTGCCSRLLVRYRRTVWECGGLVLATTDDAARRIRVGILGGIRIGIRAGTGAMSRSWSGSRVGS